jgi:superoxide dismutase, Fe-Mn family
MTFEVPPLPYAFDALEPYIDAQTMQIHHDMHHGAYVNNLNTALQSQPDLQSKSIEDLIRNLNSVPESVRAAVRNNGGGHFNHSIFWTLMAPNAGGEPTGAIAEVIHKKFVWLVRSANGDIEITSTPNQDNPLTEGHYPILGNDVWEHAYYLKYQNRRPEYLKQWWNTVNWEEVNKRYAEATR